MSNYSDTQKKVIILAALVGIIALLHYATPTEPHYFHKIHIILRKLYFLPPVIAAAWFGFRGAIITTTTVSVLFLLHAFLDWPGNYMEQANQLGELAGFWLAGLISGRLFDRQRSLLMDLATANEETLIGLVSALDLREHNTRMHSQRVRDYTELIADRLGVDEKMKREIGFGALLHDVGKIAVPDQILLKPGKLTDEEWIEMRKHPEAGYRIVKRIGFLKDAAEIVHAHHERYDGKGYPRGLKGNEIPWGARMFMVADAYDALTSKRPYKSPLPYEEAVIEILNQKGKQFDPEVVAIFLIIAPDELRLIAERYQDGDLPS
ncbi:HD-GYP domain-containing protein [Pelobacter propionicus]|uniref:Metal dependent phosphohydrolase n=1 Tax=Pelobacter propionicus (strain DSM 2379 / NBRC 103807 / OttBd1) TaxID=338966 RepID=A0R7M2_PELPD|nr:HD domain-containing phosphohydrolase [Pelobacter propionicus]ABL01232.1 metal dependent phosphohydrolase [Pelobacter propionicus DSM 2379]